MQRPLNNNDKLCLCFKIQNICDAILLEGVQWNLY